MSTGNNFLLVDDHSIVRSGIKALINEKLAVNVIHEAENGTELTALVKKNDYDIILLDINMPDTDFPAVMDWLKKTASGSRILVFTTYSESIYGVRSIQLGASGFLHKTAPNDEIIQAIQRLLENRKYISAELAELMIGKKSVDSKLSSPFDDLSSREMEIAILLDKGITLPDICRQLNIQYSTANTYKRRIFEKLNVFSLISLTRLMRSYGIVY